MLAPDPDDFAGRAALSDHVLSLAGGDPFSTVLDASSAHREEHGAECGLYPAGPHVMSVAATLVRLSGARRIIDLGCGFGHSTLWLARAAGEVDDVEVVGVDKFPDHVEQARRFAAELVPRSRVEFLWGDAARVLADLTGPFDLVHDDAWFAAEPAYYEQVVSLLAPGGVWSMPNWFLLEDALTGRPRQDWSAFAGDDWPRGTLAYARRLAEDRRLDVTWIVSPPLAVAVKKR